MWGSSENYAGKTKQKPQQRQNIASSLNLAQKNIQNQIKNGSILISRSQTIENNSSSRVQRVNQLDRQVYKKKQLIQKQMSDLDKELKIKQEVLKKAKRQISIIRYASHEANKQYQQKKKQDIQKQVHKWQREKHLVQLKKKQQQQRRNIRKQLEQEKHKKQQLQKQEFLKLQKRKQIEQRIKRIQMQKIERQKKLYQIPRSMSTHAVIPRYKVAQLDYRKKQMQKQFQMELARRRNKEKIAIDPEKLKQHEKAYIERIKERLNMKIKAHNDSDSDAKGKVKSDFNLYLNRKDDKMKQQLQKVKRRQKFQQKISKIPLNVDQKKKIQREINIDKAKNPHKYMFLGQKSLNDQQIYRQFKQFQIKTDARQIGKQYLQKLRESPKKLRASKSTVLNRQQTINSQRPVYKNYMQEVKVKRRKPQNEIQQIKRAYKKNPQLVKQMLNQKSIGYEEQALRKIKELNKQSRYEDSLKKQNQIDEMFFKSLETKLATAELI